MKLRNKQTGEIGNLVLNINPNRESYSVLSTENGDTVCGNLVLADYDSLVELNEEWEDYEEPKECEYWYIEADSEILQCHKPYYINHLLDKQKAIGNYFETKEEAEKAVEKLKAWKRLKDNGLVIKKWSHTPDMHLTTGSFLKIEGFIPEIIKNMKDLDLLFGGEE